MRLFPLKYAVLLCSSALSFAVGLAVKAPIWQEIKDLPPLSANHTGQVLSSLLQQSDSICFIGDSITAGSENGGTPWFTPLLHGYKGKIFNLSHGGGTTHSLLSSYKNNKIKADNYIIAIGTNDIRYKDQRGAQTSTEYINNISAMVQLIQTISSSANLVFIAPWCSIPEDPIPRFSKEEKEARFKEYTMALKTYCQKNGFHYIDPNPALRPILNEPALRQDYVFDHIHPNAKKGVYLYSSAILHSS